MLSETTRNGDVKLSDKGFNTDNWISKFQKDNPGVRVDHYVIMPAHISMIGAKQYDRMIKVPLFWRGFRVRPLFCRLI